MVKSTMTRAVVAEVEELIREIAAKHGIAVSPDDPIFVLQTINQRLLADSAKAQQVMLDRYKEEMEVIAHAWSTDAKSKAERVLNVSLTVSKEMAAKIMLEGAAATAASVRGEVDAALGRVTGTLRQSSRLVSVNIVVAALDSDGGRPGALGDSPTFLIGN
jgi:hypothetical protein